MWVGVDASDAIAHSSDSTVRSSDSTLACAHTRALARETALHRDLDRGPAHLVLKRNEFRITI